MYQGALMFGIVTEFFLGLIDGGSTVRAVPKSTGQFGEHHPKGSLDEDSSRLTTSSAMKKPRN